MTGRVSFFLIGRVRISTFPRSVLTEDEDIKIFWDSSRLRERRVKGSHTRYFGHRIFGGMLVSCEQRVRSPQRRPSRLPTTTYHLKDKVEHRPWLIEICPRPNSFCSLRPCLVCFRASNLPQNWLQCALQNQLLHLTSSNRALLISLTH